MFQIKITYTDGAIYNDPCTFRGFHAAEKAARALAADMFDAYGSFVAVRVMSGETEHLWLRVGK